jgi:hypothetical protein
MATGGAEQPISRPSDGQGLVSEAPAYSGGGTALPTVDRVGLLKEAGGVKSFALPFAMQNFALTGDDGPAIAPADGSDRTATLVVPPEDTPAKLYELAQLKHNAGNAKGPDAMVRVPENFDPTKPINIVIYNHGFFDSAKSAVTNADLSEQMAKAPPNTVLIVPEWQKKPASATSDQGTFEKSGQFKGMLQDIFDGTPELKGKSLQNVDHIGIVSHSAGYEPTESELYNNDFGDKVNSVTLLDSLYDAKGLDPWIEKNLKDLSSGKKQFTNILGDSTAAHSKALAQRVEEMLGKAGLPKSSMLTDYTHGQDVMDGATLAQHPIIFKYSNATIDGKGPHMSLPNLYLDKVEMAAALHQSETPGVNQVNPLEPVTPVEPSIADTDHNEAPQVSKKPHGVTPLTSEQLVIAKEILAYHDGTVDQKVEAMVALYKAGTKDARGRVHVSLEDGGKTRTFEISKESVGKDVHLIEMYATDDGGNQHPVLRAVVRGEAIEKQRDKNGDTVDFAGDWWSSHAKGSTVTDFGTQ